MTYYNRVKWVLGILMIFGVIFATNKIDSANFKRIKSSIDTIYRDRLVASDLIFDMSQLIHSKEVALLGQEKTSFLEDDKAFNLRINDLIMQFSDTKLTEDEANIFDDFKESVETLRSKEFQFQAGVIGNQNQILGQLGIVRKHLVKLSRIQIQEGKRQLSISDEASNKIELYSQIELYLLIFLAILVQVVIMYRPTRVVNLKYPN